METEELVLHYGHHRLAATKIYPADRCKPSILSLHGMGNTATRHSIRYLLNHLADYGYASMCFEYSGNGDSTGSLEGSCLRQRWEETLIAAEQLDKENPTILIGTSMGGHLAVWVTPIVQPQGLILFCPSTYSKCAIDLKFDKNFQRPGYYADSLAYSSIREFTGNLLIIASKNDEVVSSDIINGYLANAHNVRSKKVFWLDGCDHYIHRWLPHQETQKDEIFFAIRQIILTCGLRNVR